MVDRDRTALGRPALFWSAQVLVVLFVIGPVVFLDFSLSESLDDLLPGLPFQGLDALEAGPLADGDVALDGPAEDAAEIVRRNGLDLGAVVAVEGGEGAIAAVLLLRGEGPDVVAGEVLFVEA